MIRKKLFQGSIVIIAMVFMVLSIVLIANKNNQAKASGNRGVIVIDPGHGWTDPGAIGHDSNGYPAEERTLNAQVAYKLGKILQSQGFDVSLSHDISYAKETVPQDIPTLLGKIDAKYDILGQLVPAINAKNPDLMISIHQNSTGNSSAKGYECYYRTSGTDPSLHEPSNYLANQAINECKSLNYITSRGVKVDDLLVLKNNVPSVLFECGFLSNPEECSNLRDSSKQQLMADCLAKAANSFIDKYNPPAKFEASAEKIDTVKINENSSKYTAIAYGIKANKNIDKVWFPTFKPGKEGADWHQGVNLGEGNWALTLDASGAKGSYCAHVYAENNGELSELLGTSTIEIKSNEKATQPQEFIAKQDANSTTFIPIANSTQTLDSNSHTRVTNIATGEMAGYTLTNTGDNTYANVSSNNGIFNKRTGDYKAELITNNQIVCGAQTNIAGPTADSIVSTKTQENSRYFTVEALGVKSPRPINKVSFAVWSEKDQKDLVWYEKSDIYKQTVYIADHKNNVGTYNIHCYADDIYGNFNFIGSTTQKIENIETNITTQATKTDETEWKIKETGLEGQIGNNIKKVEFPIWSKDNQSDIKWYNATKEANGDWQTNLKIADHAFSMDTYKIHCYVTTSDDKLIFMGASSIDLTKPQATQITTTSTSSKTFEVNIQGVTSAKSKVKSVEVPIWSKPDQSDIKWYSAQSQGNNNWVVKADIANHKYNTGKYNIHVYVAEERGTFSKVGNTFKDVDKIEASITTQATKTDETEWRIKATGLEGQIGNNIKKVEFPIWSKDNQSDIKWYNATKEANGDWQTNLKIADHAFSTDTYKVHCYATTSDGQLVFMGGNSISLTKPQATELTSKSTSSSTFEVNIQGVTSAKSKVKSVEVPIWSKPDQSDIKWYNAQSQGNNNWVVKADIANHKYNTGKYNIHVYVAEERGTFSMVGATTQKVEGIHCDSLNIEGSKGGTSFKVWARGLYDADEDVTEVKFPIWSKNNGQKDIIWHNGTKSGNDWYIDVNLSDYTNPYGSLEYDIHVYGYTKSISKGQMIGTTDYKVDGYKIMGNSEVGNRDTTINKMVNYYNSKGKTYPSYYGQNGQPSNIREMAEVFYNQATSEGVKPEIVFAQSMKETGFLQFGGQVKIEQYNFAGIGAVDGGAQGAQFNSVEEGILAQVQHLKAYASAESLRKPKVDPRFDYVTRNSATIVEWLGINNNPYGKGWASDPNYGSGICAMIDDLKTK